MANIGIRLNVDSSGAKQGVDSLNDSVQRLNSEMSKLEHLGGSPGASRDAMAPYRIGQRNLPAQQLDINSLKAQLENFSSIVAGISEDIKTAWGRGDLEAVTRLSGSLESAKQAEVMTQRQLKEAEAQAARDAAKSGGGALKQYLAAQFAMQMVSSAISAGDLILDSRKSFASGNYVQSMVQQEKGIGQLIGQSIGTALGAIGGTLIAPGAGTIAGGALVGSVGRYLGGLFGEIKEIDLAYAEQYQNRLPGIEKFHAVFNQNLAGQNNSVNALNEYVKVANAAMGTGFSPDELLEATMRMAGYSNKGMDASISAAKRGMAWSRFTGADLGTVEQFEGMALRYGGDTSALSKAYGGMRASGLDKAQYGEFLGAMSRIMTEGIEKGFALGAGEIAENLATISKLSGGDMLWSGEQGAKRISQISGALAASVNLDSVDALLNYQAVAGLIGSEADYMRMGGASGDYTGTYIDALVMMERGFKPAILAEQLKLIQGLEGDNTAAQIERIKSMTGLNYAGAQKLWQMGQNADFLADPEKYAKEIDLYTKDPQYQSDQVKLTDALNKLATEGVKTGKMKFDEVTMTYLEKATGELARLNANLEAENATKEIQKDAIEKLGEDLNSETILKGVMDALGPDDPNRFFLSPLFTLMEGGGTAENPQLISKIATGMSTFNWRDESAVSKYIDDWVAIADAVKEARGKKSEGGVVITGDEAQQIIELLKTLNTTVASPVEYEMQAPATHTRGPAQ